MVYTCPTTHMPQPSDPSELHLAVEACFGWITCPPVSYSPHPGNSIEHQKGRLRDTDEPCFWWLRFSVVENTVQPHAHTHTLVGFSKVCESLLTRYFFNRLRHLGTPRKPDDGAMKPVDPLSREEQAPRASMVPLADGIVAVQDRGRRKWVVCV